MTDKDEMPVGTWHFVLIAIIDAIRRARSSIAFMAFSFTDNQIGDAIIERFKAGVTVGGIFEKRGASTPYSEFGQMRDLGMNVQQDTNRYAMHHKVIVIDADTVITGAFNFSREDRQRRTMRTCGSFAGIGKSHWRICKNTSG